MLKYNKVTLYGESNVDYLWIRNSVLTTEQIAVINDKDYNPAWTDDTVMIAPFLNNLGGGNDTSVTEEINQWLLYKKKEGDVVFTFVGQSSPNQLIIMDYNIKDNDEYQYSLFASTTNYLSQEMPTSLVTSTWDNWYIMDLTKGSTDTSYYVDINNIWSFTTMLTTEDLVQNVDRFTFEGFSKYPKVAVGVKNYITSGLTAYINNVYEGIYTDNVEMQNRFNEFINNGNVKLLKDRKGNSMIVETMSNNFKYIDESVEQITTVNFTFTQVGSTDGLTINGGV